VFRQKSWQWHAAVAFGVQAVINNPTNIFAKGTIYTSATTPTVNTLSTLATTTATAVVSATPSGYTFTAMATSGSSQSSTSLILTVQ
jgi:PKD repeat protein